MLNQSPTPCKHRNERQGAMDAENARKYSVLRFFRVHYVSASPWEGLGMRRDDTWTELRAIEDFADGYSCEYVFAPSETSRALIQELSLKRDRIQR